jgi:hypothetical protein
VPAKVRLDFVIVNLILLLMTLFCLFVALIELLGLPMFSLLFMKFWLLFVSSL